MKYFLEFVIGELVEQKDEVDIREIESPKGILYEVRLNPSDIGRVIGRNGKTIGSIRSLLSAAASKNHKRMTLEIIDDTSGDR